MKKRAIITVCLVFHFSALSILIQISNNQDIIKLDRTSSAKTENLNLKELLMMHKGYEYNGQSDSSRAIRKENRIESKIDSKRQKIGLKDQPPGYIGKLIEHIRNMPKRYPGESLAKNSNIQSSGWTNRGPMNIGGRTRALALDVSDESRILAGGVSGGMWLSEDDGITWLKTTRPDQLHSITCIAQDTRPGKTNVWYYGSGEFSGSGGYGNGIYKSIDNGNSWEVLTGTTADSPELDNYFDCVWRIVTNPNNTEQDEVLAACYSGIMRSTDGGETWNKVLGTQGLEIEDNNISCPYSDVLITSEGIYYAAIGSPGSSSWTAGIYEGLFRSVNGIHWTEVSPEVWQGRHERIVIANSDTEPDVVYFLSYSPGYGNVDHNLLKYTYLSGDGSGIEGSWEDLSQFIPDGNTMSTRFISYSGYTLDISIAPHNPDLVFIGGIHLFRSTDGFETDEQITRISNYDHSIHHVDQHEVLFKNSNPNWMYNANDGGVWKNNNYQDPNAGTSWINLNSGYITSQFYNVAIDHAANNDKVIIGGTQDNGTLFTDYSSDEGEWKEFMPGDGIMCAVADNKEYYYAGHTIGHIVRFKLNSDGDIEDWNYFGPGDSENGRFSCYRMTLDPNNSNRMYLTDYDYIWRNNDLASIPVSNDVSMFNWEKLENTKYEGDYINAIGLSENPSNILYFGTREGRVFRVDNAHEEDPEPEPLYSNRFPSYKQVNCIAVNPEDGNDILIVFENYGNESLYHSSDGGNTVTHVTGNLRSVDDGKGIGPVCYWAEILPVGGENLYFIATTAGLFSTTSLNGFDTVWKQEGPETIGCVPVMMIDSRSTDGFVVVATHGNGVYSANFTEISTNVENKNLPLPVKFKLEQNYPNPFNAGTTIGFTLPEYSTVKVAVFNILGQEVRTLLTSNMPSGSHKVRWDGRDNFGRTVSSGTYIYRVIAGNWIKSKKMILIK